MAPPQRRVDIGAIDDFPVGQLRVVEVGRLELGIVRWPDDRFYAVHNRCPHQGAPICRGIVGPKVTSRNGTAGTAAVDPETPVLTCPWHHWEFSIETGRALWDEKYRVRTYEAATEDGRVVVRLGRRAGAGEA